MLSSLINQLVWNPYLNYLIGLSSAIIILVWLVYEWKEYQAKWKCRQQNLPYVRMPSQMLALIRQHRYDLIEKQLADRMNVPYGGYFFNNFTISIHDAELVQIVCNKEFTKFTNRRVFETYDKIFDNMLFSTIDDKWKRIRAIVSPTFSAGKLRKVKYCIDDTVKTLISHINEKIEKDPVLNIKHVAGTFTLDTIIQMGYGIKIDSLREPNNKMIKMARRLFSADISIYDTIFFALMLFCPQIIKWTGMRFQPDVLDYFENCSQEIVKKKREELKMKPENFRASNFIELILECEHEIENLQNGDATKALNGNSKPFKYLSTDELIAQCVVFFTVGYDTTATAITNACYLLASNPDKQEKLYESIMSTLEQLKKENGSNTDDPHQLITFDTLGKFEYLSAVLDETLRFYTIATATERTAADDVRLETADKKTWFDVKKDDIVRIVVNSLHGNPEYFSNPDCFIPERFMANNDSGHTCNRQAYMPFGSGPRNCLARSLALLEAKMALVYLVQNFKFNRDPKLKPIDFYINSDLVITKDVYLRVEKRK